MNTTERFFYENAGFSYDSATETAEQGHRRCAREYAAAEARFLAGPYYVTTEPDPEPWDGDEPYDGPLWIVTLWAETVPGSPEPLGSIGSVACEESAPYMRVIRADLVTEYIDGK